MLALILNFLGGGVLSSVLKHLENKADNETERERIRTSVTIEEVKAEINRRNAQKDIVVAQFGHPLAWVPRFLVELSAALYFMSIVIDSMFQLPGDISELPPATAAVMATIFGGMFLQSAANQIIQKIGNR